MCAKTLLNIAIILVITTAAYSATEPRSFNATCIDKQTHGYRANTDLTGERMLPDTWSTDEKFIGGHFETFRYISGQNSVHLTKRNLNAPIVAKTSNTIIFVDVHQAETAISLWSYAVNLRIKKIVGTQVNAFENFGTGLKARVVELQCEFLP